MNIKPVFVLICSGMVWVSACSKDDHHPPAIHFEGITPRDLTASLTGVPDPTDWQLTDQWSETEQRLFKQPSTKRIAKLTGVGGPGDLEILAFPNPATGSFHIDVSGQDTTSSLAYRIVDRNYKVLKSEDSAASWSFRINSADLMAEQDTVRIYYKITSGDKEYRGHGDVAINVQ